MSDSSDLKTKRKQSTRKLSTTSDSEEKKARKARSRAQAVKTREARQAKRLVQPPAPSGRVTRSQSSEPKASSSKIVLRQSSLTVISAAEQTPIVEKTIVEEEEEEGSRRRRKQYKTKKERDKLHPPFIPSPVAHLFGDKQRPVQDPKQKGLAIEKGDILPVPQEEQDPADTGETSPKGLYQDVGTPPQIHLARDSIETPFKTPEQSPDKTQTEGSSLDSSSEVFDDPLAKAFALGKRGEFRKKTPQRKVYPEPELYDIPTELYDTPSTPSPEPSLELDLDYLNLFDRDREAELDMHGPGEIVGGEGVGDGEGGVGAGGGPPPPPPNIDRRVRNVDPLRHLPTFIGDPLVDKSNAKQHLEDFERYLVANELPWQNGVGAAAIRLVMQRFQLSLKGRARSWWDEDDNRIPVHPNPNHWLNVKNAFLARFNPYGNTRESLIYEWENLQYKTDDDIEKFIERAKVIGAGLVKTMEEIVEKVRMKLPPPLGNTPFKFTLHTFADIIRTHNQMLHMPTLTAAPQAVVGSAQSPYMMAKGDGTYHDFHYMKESKEQNDEISNSLKKIGKKISALTTSVNTVQNEVSYVNEHVNSVADTVYSVEKQTERQAEKQATWRREDRSRERDKRGRYTPRSRSFSRDKKNDRGRGRSYSSGASRSRSRGRSEQARYGSENREKGRTYGSENRDRGRSFRRGPPFRRGRSRDSSNNSTDRNTWNKRQVSFNRRDQSRERNNGRDRNTRDGRDRNARDNRERSPYRRPFPGECDHCGRRGHMWRNCIQLQKEMMQKLSKQKDSDSEDEEETTNYIGNFGSGISKGYTFGAHLTYAQVARELDYNSLN